MVALKIIRILLTGFLIKVSGNIITFNQDDYENLVAVAVVYRHGDRSPETSFPNDAYFNKTYWPMGFGQLTKAGVNRQYELGKWFRRRYNTFLSEIYSPNEMYIFSTNTDRSLMSATVNLAGLYPPSDFQIWNEKIPWQPIPVHTESRHKDDIFIDKRFCRRFSEAYKELKTKKYNSLEKEYSFFLNYIKNNTGWEKVTLKEVRELQRTLYAYQHYNESFIPEWAKSMDQTALDYLSVVVSVTPASIPQLARLRIGPFYSCLFKHFDTFVNSSPTEDKPKFLMISAHDSTISSILGGMGVLNFPPVGFADTVIWELRKRNDDTYFINVLYKRNDELDQLNINDCEFNCDYDLFKGSMSNITVDVQQWKQECDNKDS